MSRFISARSPSPPPTRLRRLYKKIRFFFYLFCLLLILWIIPQIWVQVAAKPLLAETIQEVQPAEAILVFGARVYPDHPSPLLAGRLDAAITLYQAGVAPKIILSGGSLGEDADEPEVMQKYLVDRGIPEESLILDKRGSNSYRSLASAKALGYRKLVLTTTNYHLPRCLFLGRSLDLEVQGWGAPNRAIYNMPYNYFRESLAQAKALFNVYIHPPTLPY